MRAAVHDIPGGPELTGKGWLIAVGTGGLDAGNRAGDADESGLSQVLGGVSRQAVSEVRKQGRSKRGQESVTCAHVSVLRSIEEGPEFLRWRPCDIATHVPNTIIRRVVTRTDIYAAMRRAIA